jgi:hypothetical protein
MAAPVRNTQIGSSFQFNVHGNSLAGTAQGTTVQLGSLNNSSTFYRDPDNPSAQNIATNKASYFINKQLLYVSSKGG